MKEDIEKILRLYKDYSARFSNYVLKSLIEEIGDKQNIALSPSRLQAILVLLANWTTPNISRWILDQAVSDIIDIKEANSLFNNDNTQPIPHKETFRDIDGNPIQMVPTIEQQTTLWYKHDLVLNTKAIDNIKNAFHVTANAVDFSDANIKNIIDEEVCKGTHGLIDRLDTDINAAMLALIVDILYFKGSWEDEFDENNTKDRMFYGTKGKVKVPTMLSDGRMDYTETSVYQAVRLPYTCEGVNHKEFAMRIYLPKNKYGVIDVLNFIQDENFELYTERKEVKLSLPRFEVANNIEVKKLLKQLRLSCVLESCDIIPQCIKGLQISDISQQVKIKVDEQGTEAAAVTFMAEAGCCPPEVEPTPKLMKVNKPFLFEIVEETTHTILFSGVINNIE